MYAVFETPDTQKKNKKQETKNGQIFYKYNCISGRFWKKTKRRAKGLVKIFRVPTTYYYNRGQNIC